MRSRRQGLRGYSLIAAAVLLVNGGVAVAATGGSNQSAPPLGTARLDNGRGTVTLQGGAHRVTLRLSPRAESSVGGRLQLHCLRLNSLGASRFAYYDIVPDSILKFRLRRGQRVVRIRTSQFTRDHTPPFCTLLQPGRAQWLSVADVPLTQEGADYLDAEDAVEPLIRVLHLLKNDFVDRLPSTDEILRTAPNERAVPLSQPSDTPPPGRLGVWGDGHDHMALVVTSRLGRRLFVEIHGMQWTTNAPGGLIGRRLWP